LEKRRKSVWKDEGQSKYKEAGEYESNPLWFVIIWNELNERRIIWWWGVCGWESKKEIEKRIGIKRTVLPQHDQEKRLYQIGLNRVKRRA